MNNTLNFEIKVPSMGESVTEVTLAKWHKNVGETVAADEIIAELETDKITLELTSPQPGIVEKILVASGNNATIGQPLIIIKAQDNIAVTTSSSSNNISTNDAAEISSSHTVNSNNSNQVNTAVLSTNSTPPPLQSSNQDKALGHDKLAALSPSAAKILHNDPSIGEVKATPGSGKHGMVTREDALAVALSANKTPEMIGALASNNNNNLSTVNFNNASQPVNHTTSAISTHITPALNSNTQVTANSSSPSDTNITANSLQTSEAKKSETKEKMSKLRQTIAKKLKESQNTAAILTTFNEIDMGEIMAWRSQNQEKFFTEFNTKLGFMSFFVKASVIALKEFPIIQSYVEGENIVYRHYYDIGVAVGTEQGLIVPILRSADKMSFSEIEQKIAELGQKARDNKLLLQEIRGGGFSITNGGIYGSMLSTPIINAPQSAILGMHNIVRRPVVIDENDTVAVRPIMYVALSYDHRIIDGRQAVGFLKKIKDLIENPAFMLFKA